MLRLTIMVCQPMCLGSREGMTCRTVSEPVKDVCFPDLCSTTLGFRQIPEQHVSVLAETVNEM